MIKIFKILHFKSKEQAYRKGVKEMNTLIIKAMVYWQMFKNRFFEEERGDVNVVSIVVLIGIAVLLAVLFKDQIGKLLQNLFNQISKSANDVVTKNI